MANIGNASLKKKSVKIEELTWIEAERVIREYKVILIPLGARTKEHGPHMPLNTDWIIAEYLANRVANEIPVILMPTIQYGYYPSFLEYPGSVSLKLNTFKEMIKDICISMSNYGVKKFYILNTGVSTIHGLKMAAEKLIKMGIEMRYTDILKALESVEKEISEQEGGTHADEIETSIMLYIKPEVVDMSKAVKDYCPMKGKGLTRNPNKKDAGAYSPSGIFGDATLASMEKGRIIVEALVKYIVDEVREFISKE